jgi:serine/threonine protein kinase
MKLSLKHLKKTRGGRLPNISTFKAFCDTHKNVIPTAWLTVHETIKTPESEDYFGQVAIASFIENRQNVVVKIYTKDDFMLQKELSILKNLTKNNICNIVKIICHFGCSRQNKLVWNDNVSGARPVCSGFTAQGDDLHFLVLEYIPSGHIGDYFAKHSVSKVQYVSFVKQCVMCLLELYDSFGLHHGDLHHGNILVDVDTPKKNSYKIQGKIYQVETNGCEPIFIDFGRASKSSCGSRKSSSSTSSSSCSKSSWVDESKINWTFQEILLLMQILGNNIRDDGLKNETRHIASMIQTLDTTASCAEYINHL